MRVVKQSLYNITAGNYNEPVSGERKRLDQNQKNIQDIEQLKSDIDKIKDYGRTADNDLINIFMALKGKISFGDGIASENISGQFVTFTSSATPNAEFSVPHTLGATPIGWIVVNKNKAGDLYKGTTVWTSLSIALKCSVASVTYKVFLI